MSKVYDALCERLGENRVQRLPKKAEDECDLLLIEMDLRSKVTVLMTDGLSDFKMPVPKQYWNKEFNEIYFCLPSYWEWDDIENPNMNWVFAWIQKLFKYVMENETWLNYGHTFANKNEVGEIVPISSTMKQNHFLLHPPLLLEEHLATLILEDKEVNFLAIIPLHENEFDYKIAKGAHKLMKKFYNAKVDEKLDDFRESALKSRWKL